MAGGCSSRFGRPKQILQLKGKYLLEHVLNAALESNLNPLVLVLGHRYQDILQKLGNCITHERLQVVINHRYVEGQSRSLQAGLEETRQMYASVMFLLGDQPMLRSDTINHLLEKFSCSDKDICVPVYKGQRGNPTIFSSVMYEQLMAIEGDLGAREIITANPERVLYVETEDPLCFYDIDSQKDFEALKLLLS